LIQSFVSGDLILVKSIQLQNWSLGNIGNTGIQGYRNTDMQNIVQGYRDTGIQEYRGTIFNTGIQGYNIYYRNTGIQFIQSGAYTGIKPAKREKNFLPPLALKMLLFYIKSTTCPLGGPFSIQGQYITMYPSV